MKLVGLIAVVAAGACARGARDTEDAAPGPPADASVLLDAACDPLGCDAVYVATTGSDTNPGTASQPLATVAAGLVMAANGEPPRPVFVATGTYGGALQMIAGVDVYGGFDATTWQRGGSAATELDGPSPVVTFTNIAVPTVLDGVTIRSADATTPGASSVAVVVDVSQQVVLSNDIIAPGAGASGGGGTDGIAGGNSGTGVAGGPGVEHSGTIFCDDHPLPVGGPGGASACGATGGIGGNPGVASASGLTGAEGGGFNGGPGGAGGASQHDGTGGLSGGFGVIGVRRVG